MPIKKLTKELRIELTEFDRAEKKLEQELKNLRERRREFINRNELNRRATHGTRN